MKVLVTQLYKKGRRIPLTVKSKVYTGSLTVTDKVTQLTARLERQAMLLNASGLMEIDPIYGVILVLVAADGFLLRGFEYEKEAQEVVQEWWVRPDVGLKE